MIDIIRPRPDARPRAALLDFDGTLSLVRSGWQQVMQHMMLDALLDVARNVPLDALRARVARAIDDYTGHPTIHQMHWLCDELARHGGPAGDPEALKRRYLALLDEHVARRLASVRGGALAPDALLVPGARALLDALHERGLLLVLASGTDLVDVRREARALGIDGYFGRHIYGPGPEAPGFTKRAVIRALLEHERLAGHQLLAIGDGPVEIQETRAAGGVTVGVAFDELAGAGLDPHKRARLIDAGADAIVADLTPADALLAHLLP